MQCIRYSAVGSKFPPMSDLTILTFHHRIPLVYSRLRAPTMSPAVDSITGQYRMRCIRYSAVGSKSPPTADLAISALHYPTPPPRSPHRPHLMYSHHAPRHQFPSRTNTCIWFLAFGVKIPTPARSRYLSLPVFNHHIPFIQ